LLGAGPEKCAGHALEMTGQSRLALSNPSCRKKAQRALPYNERAPGA
jgi:hypothetical protein